MDYQNVIEIDAWEKTGKKTDFAPRLRRECFRDGIPFDTIHLVTGDIRFLTANLEIVLIERKSTDGDLYSSSTKRLQDQCLRLIDEADVPVLVMDGQLYLTRDGYMKAGRHKTGWRWSSISHMLLSLQERGLRILWVPNKHQTPQEMVSLYRYYQKKEHTSVLQARLKPFPTTPKGLTPQEQKLRILLAIPGVGNDIARKLLMTYNSVTGVAGAPISGLTSIPGVGKSTAKKIKEVLS